MIGPPQSNVDFTLGKTFKLAESQNLRFRAGLFNLFNRHREPSSFSQITSVVGTPRLIQFSLKYSF